MIGPMNFERPAVRVVQALSQQDSERAVSGKDRKPPSNALELQQAGQRIPLPFALGNAEYLRQDIFLMARQEVARKTHDATHFPLAFQSTTRTLDAGELFKPGQRPGRVAPTLAMINRLALPADSFSCRVHIAGD